MHAETSPNTQRLIEALLLTGQYNESAVVEKIAEITQAHIQRMDALGLLAVLGEQNFTIFASGTPEKIVDDNLCDEATVVEKIGSDGVANALFSLFEELTEACAGTKVHVRIVDLKKTESAEDLAAEQGHNDVERMQPFAEQPRIAIEFVLDLTNTNGYSGGWLKVMTNTQQTASWLVSGWGH